MTRRSEMAGKDEKQSSAIADAIAEAAVTLT
jgi:hypothetical protein